MSIPFTGRKTELDHVQQLINDKQGAVFAITGKSGMGKSTLLREIEKRHANKGCVLVDMDNKDVPLQTAVLFLQYFADRTRGFIETKKALTKINGTYKDAYALSVPYQAILQETVQLGFEQHSEELELADDEKSKITTLAKIGMQLFGVWSKNGQEKAKAKLGDPELVLLNALKQDCENQPLILIDTYERLHAAQELCQQKIASRYAKPDETLKPVTANVNFQDWLERLLKFLKQHGAIVIVAGRTTVRGHSAQELELFNDDDIANAVVGSDYGELQTLLTDDAQAAALFNIINRLSFNGIPLWLQLALNFLNAKLNEGYDIHELAAMPDIQQLFAEPEDSRDLNTDNIDNARCKLALFKRVMQHNLALEEQTWRMALPRRLDKDVLKLLYAEQANSMREAFSDMGLLKTEKGTHYLHEEIRDLLLSYARYKNWLDSEQIKTLHQQLAHSFTQRHQQTNHIEYLLESLYHQLMTEEQTQLDTMQDTELLVNMALQLEAEKQYAKMSQVFLRLIAIQPEHEDYYYGLGIALYHSGKFNEAIQAYQQQLSIKPNDEKALGNLGIIYWKQGQLALAQQTFAQALTHHPQDLSALSNDAELALVQQDNVRCLARLQSALALVSNEDQESVILPFLAWLADPEQPTDNIYTAIEQLDPSVKITWNFSDIEPAIARVNPDIQHRARQFIAYFQGVGDLS
jgi:Flp pilus assembly protein TadD